MIWGYPYDSGNHHIYFHMEVSIKRAEPQKRRGCFLLGKILDMDHDENGYPPILGNLHILLSWKGNIRGHILSNTKKCSAFELIVHRTFFYSWHVDNGWHQVDSYNLTWNVQSCWGYIESQICGEANGEVLVGIPPVRFLPDVGNTGPQESAFRKEAAKLAPLHPVMTISRTVRTGQLGCWHPAAVESLFWSGRSTSVWLEFLLLLNPRLLSSPVPYGPFPAWTACDPCVSCSTMFNPGTQGVLKQHDFLCFTQCLFQKVYVSPQSGAP